jgi:hypothetical protein
VSLHASDLKVGDMHKQLLSSKATVANGVIIEKLSCHVMNRSGNVEITETITTKVRVSGIGEAQLCTVLQQLSISPTCSPRHCGVV